MSNIKLFMKRKSLIGNFRERNNLHKTICRGKILPMDKLKTDKRALGVRVKPSLIKKLKRKALDADLTLEQLINPVLEALVENEAIK